MSKQSATKVDWLSFTMPIQPEMSDPDMQSSVVMAFHNYFSERVFLALADLNWVGKDKGRAPYKIAWSASNEGLSVYCHPNLSHMTFEASGKGCDWLRENGIFETILVRSVESVTRIDLATDILTTTTPEEFINAQESKRFKTTGRFKSPSGDTCYVGSQKSEMFSRVYRYAEPHPRSPFLRIEHVLRRKYAKQVATRLCEVGEDVSQAEIGNSFVWRHDDWLLRSVDTGKLKVQNPERNGGRTLFWVLTSVAPALQRLISEGVIQDPEAFFQAHFMPKAIID